ncbi:MAG: asparagine--tRNA ligase [Planctomycetota bacterium]|nr:MAG: asparagine--tRNA ligase [Planctomycetota bacterium]
MYQAPSDRIVEILHREPASDPIGVYGWVRSRRDSKAGVSFIDLSDGSCLQGLQIVVPSDLENYSEVLERAVLGASIRVTGQLVASQGRGQAVEVQASEVAIIGDCDPEHFPIQKQHTSLEHLRSIPHLRIRTRTFQAIMRIRSYLAHSVHSFFASQGFAWVHTPIITASDCEGAGAMFRVSTLDADQPPRNEQGNIDWSQDFFGREAWLTVSGQLEGETYACGLGRVYTFGPTFRAENSNTSRHLSEFWMIEPEMAFCDLDGNRHLAGAFLRSVIGNTLQACEDDITFLERQLPSARGLRRNLDVIANKDLRHITYDEAIERLIASGKSFEFPVHWGIDLQAEHERFLVDTVFKGPVAVTNYPKEIKAFYMRLDDNHRTVAAMDVLVPRMGELIGGAQREDRLDILRQRLHESGLDPEAYTDYLDLRRFGSVPHAGFGLGFERLVCLVTGASNIRDVIPYPRTPGHCP